MKRLLLSIAITLLLAVQAFAAGTVVLGTVEFYPSRNNPTVIVIPLVCTTDASAGTLPAFDITSAAVGTNYFKNSYRIADVFTVNNADTPPTSTAALSIVDSLGRQLIGTTAGDTITVGTGASVISYLSIDRGSSQRHIIRQLTQSAISGSMGNSKIFTTYIILQR